MVFVVGGGYASTVNKQTEAGFFIKSRIFVGLILKNRQSYSILE